MESHDPDFPVEFLLARRTWFALVPIKSECVHVLHEDNERRLTQLIGQHFRIEDSPFAVQEWIYLFIVLAYP